MSRELRGYVRALLALSMLATADALNALAERLAHHVGGRSGDFVTVHFAQWRIVKCEDSRLWSLYLPTLDPSEAPYGWAVYEPVRIGRIVLVSDFAPDGGGVTYVLDALEEITYDPAETIQ